MQRLWPHNQHQKDQCQCTGCHQAPSIKIDDRTLNVVEEFTHLGSTISMNLCLETEINKRIGKASATMAKLIPYAKTPRCVSTKHAS